MTPQPGQLIEVRFNNGVFFDAEVISWSAEQSVLKLKDDDIVIIQKTAQDVLLVKIYKAASSQPKAEPTAPTIVPHIDDPDYRAHLESEFNELKNQKKTNFSLRRMTELKDELNRLERQELLDKRKLQEKREERIVKYGIPGNIKVARVAQHTDQKIASTDNGIDQELQNLFK